MTSLQSWLSWLSSDIRGGIYRGSNNLSLFIRKRIERLNLRQILGLNLAGLAFFGAVIMPQASDFISSIEVMVETQETIVHVVPTQSKFQWPLSRFAISQRFYVAHPGMDLTAPLGTPVYPVANGRVSIVNILYWGFGNHVIIEHDKGIASLYAHLSKVEVKEGQEVTKATRLGAVGSTGWSTGNHLHLEVYQDGIPINPIEVLPEIKQALP